MVTAADELLALVAPPEDPPPPPDWEAVERDLGVRLPADYKWLVERYGPGSFGRFLHVLTPGGESQYVRLEAVARRAVQLLDSARETGLPLPIPPEELLPVAVTDNGDTVYWVRRPADDPDAWHIAANGARNTKWPEFDGGVVAFLASVMSGAHPVDVLPASFPGNRRTFDQY
jgi:hypothetical protein